MSRKKNTIYCYLTVWTLEGMSDGTCYKLYLPLRLASLEKGHLASEAIKTQVIFFTHHRHLAGLAKANIDKKVLFTHSLAY